MKDLTKGSVTKHFFSYLLPSIAATLVTSIYTLADTIMIGQYEGDDGLLALNIFLPVYSLYIAVGTLFGVGGGVHYSLSIGRGDEKKARNYFTNSLIMLGAVTALLTVVLNVWFDPVMRLFGADDGSLPLVKNYGKYVAYAGFTVTAAIFLQAFIRNDRDPKLAMIGVVSGGIFNIVLDYILIFVADMGMAGGALATVISYGLTTGICCIHFFRKDNGLKFSGGFGFKRSCEVAASGASSFAIEMALGLMIIILNNQLLKFIGSYGVVTYGVITNTLIVAVSMFNGVGQACQPIAAVNFGAGNTDNVVKLRRLAYAVIGALSVVILLPVQIAPNAFVRMFTSAPSAEVLELAPYAVRVYFACIPFMGFNIFFTSYYQSVARAGAAFMISILRGILIGGVLAYVLPPLLGGNSLWYVIPAAEILTCALGFSLVRKSLDRSAKNRRNNTQAETGL